MVDECTNILRRLSGPRRAGQSHVRVSENHVILGNKSHDLAPSDFVVWKRHQKKQLTVYGGRRH